MTYSFAIVFLLLSSRDFKLVKGVNIPSMLIEWCYFREDDPLLLGLKGRKFSKDIEEILRFIQVHRYTGCTITSRKIQRSYPTFKKPMNV